MPMVIRYLGTHLAFSFGITLLLNWAILWYDPDLLTLGNYRQDTVEETEHTADSTEKVDCGVVVGVLSARENFEARKAIRDTWWSSVADHHRNNTTNSICQWFIVGKESCDIDSFDRLTAYDCRHWEVNAKDSLQESVVHLSSVVQNGQRSAEKKSAKIYTAFTFNVHHPIVVSKLGVMSKFNDTSSHSTVILEDAVSKEVVAKVTIGGDLQPGVIVGGYIYRAIEPVLLPRGFEGTVILKTDEELGVVDDDDDLRIVNDAAGGVITFQHATTNTGEFDVFTEQTVLITSFGYSIHDVEGLKQKLAERSHRQAEWSLKIAADAKRLEEEMKEHGDIVVVDALDVYRNLTQKLLAFYEWISKRYDYDIVIKADDDSVLDIGRIKEHLKHFSSVTNTWWGQFRNNWIVQRHGKWKELSYRSVTYPLFACGTAYALTSDLVAWLAANRNLLKTYQGEDVSMGIWMAALGPTMAHDTRWQCSDGCIDGAFTRGQLEPSAMKTAWKSFVDCGNVCECI